MGLKREAKELEEMAGRGIHLSTLQFNQSRFSTGTLEVPKVCHEKLIS
jgi:hypothetical protein